jgi:hypothetical protein
MQILLDLLVKLSQKPGSYLKPTLFNSVSLIQNLLDSYHCFYSYSYSFFIHWYRVVYLPNFR